MRAPKAHRRLGVKLIALFLVLALALAAVFVGGMQRALAFGWSEFGRPLVNDYIDHLAAEVGSPPDPARARALEERLPIRVVIDGPSRPHGDRQFTRSTAEGHRIRFELSSPSWHDGPRSIGWVALLVLLALIALAYHAVRRLFRPIDEIRAGAMRFGQGDFATPIPVRRSDELGELAAQVNTMASELQAMLDAKRELLLAISHELRSPLTRARLNAELVGEGRPRDALLRDLNEMRELITQLLEHERLAAGHHALQRERLDVVALVQGLIAEHFPDAHIALTTSPEVGEAQIDPTRLRMALRNLLHNALTHGASAAGPVLEVTQHAGVLRFTVRDQGTGLPVEQLTRLAEPFYRPDSARTREQGGVGLGLSLVRSVARAHGGELTLRPGNPGFEASFTINGGP